jgi:hypothetical protein
MHPRKWKACLTVECPSCHATGFIELFEIRPMNDEIERLRSSISEASSLLVGPPSRDRMLRANDVLVRALSAGRQE